MKKVLGALRIEGGDIRTSSEAAGFGRCSPRAQRAAAGVVLADGVELHVQRRRGGAVLGTVELGRGLRVRGRQEVSVPRL